MKFGWSSTILLDKEMESDVSAGRLHESSSFLSGILKISGSMGPHKRNIRKVRKNDFIERRNKNFIGSDFLIHS
jgi:hypothetical protein